MIEDLVKSFTHCRSIQDLNLRMDQMFKLIQETMKANKAFRDLVSISSP